MNKKQLLKRFQAEVIMLGPETTLPYNLSNFWLLEIQQSIELYFDSEKRPQNSTCLALAAVVHILLVKNGGEPIEASMEEIVKHLEDYKIELALEEIRRKTRLKIEPATIASIFTNREVMMSKPSEVE